VHIYVHVRQNNRLSNATVQVAQTVSDYVNYKTVKVDGNFVDFKT